MAPGWSGGRRLAFRQGADVAEAGGQAIVRHEAHPRPVVPGWRTGCAAASAPARRLSATWENLVPSIGVQVGFRYIRRSPIGLLTTQLLSKGDGAMADNNEFDRNNIFGKGEKNTAYAQYFIGTSYVNPLTEPGHAPVFLANVTFEPGCRNNWHIHHAARGGGQILICTAGSGWYQQEGQPPRSLNPGDVVVIPAGAKHWHGAKADSWFSHIALEVPGEETRTEWLEPVSDAEYAALTEADS